MTLSSNVMLGLLFILVALMVAKEVRYWRNERKVAREWEKTRDR